METADPNMCALQNHQEFHFFDIIGDYNIVTYRSIARQRLDKHVLAETDF
jgi:hypothetical protein